MIEPTDEMRSTVAEHVDRAMRRALAAAYMPRCWSRIKQEAVADIVAAVERDLKPPPGPCAVLGPSFHVGHPLLCDLRHGHEGDHESGDGARWRYAS